MKPAKRHIIIKVIQTYPILLLVSLLLIVGLGMAGCGDNGSGPDQVDNRLNFVGDYENKDYEIVFSQLSGENQEDTTITVTATSQIQINLADGSMNEVELDIEEFIVDGWNFLLNELGQSGFALTFDDPVFVEISGKEFEFEGIDIYISDSGNSFFSNLMGEGIMQENGNILFSFEFFFTDDFGTQNMISGEAELEKQ